ncbi:MAG: hypothetical protein DRI73_06150 [Bacteroidetes bacterium]|nr:MAG: hypothetical protein DRI73_06150 [Bacteroidota bacterium]
MEKAETQYLNLLKTAVVDTMKQSYPGIANDISDWKGQDIINFQEDLLEKVNEHISEKWFYSHMKSENEKLPRIDMLNFLSRYVGYIDWRDFKYQNRENILLADQNNKPGKTSLYLKISGLLLLLVVSIVLVKFAGNKSYQFAFKDAHTKRRITDTLTEIIIMNENESPVYEKCDPPGYYNLKTKKEKICFMVKSPYYETDTITRVLDKFEGSESIYLYPNDFAIMIHYFSATNVKDWEKRRSHLDRMISDSAFIYQFFDEGQVGMELYNKEEFIDKLTMPVNSLKNIEIMETIYTGRKISVLRFRQLEME